MKLLVVIVNYRVTDLTIDCLHSIANKITSVPGLRVAVCENGTGDDSAERLARAISEHGWDQWCTLTAISPNRGFTGGNNAVIRPALQSDDPPEYTLLLNADTVVLDGALSALVDFMDNHPAAGIAGSRLEDPSGAPYCSAFRFHSPFSEFERGVKLGFVTWLLNRWTITPPEAPQACQTDWVPGASMIIRRKVFEEVGLLDEGYYTYFDDPDFCFNARKAGWSTWYVPESRVIHLEGKTTGITAKNLVRRPSYLFEARRRYFLKNHGPLYAALADGAIIFGSLLWRARVLLGKRDSTPPHFLRDMIRHSVFIKGFTLPTVENPALANRESYE